MGGLGFFRYEDAFGIENRQRNRCPLKQLRTLALALTVPAGLAAVSCSSEVDPGMPDSREWAEVTGAGYNEFLDVSAVERTGNFGGSASAFVRREEDVFALADRNDAARTVLVWTIEGIDAEGQGIRLAFDLEDVAPQGGWVVVTLSLRTADGPEGATCMFSPDGEQSGFISGGAAGQSFIEGRTLVCEITPENSQGDLDVYIYPTAYRPDVGFDNRLVGEIFISSGQVYFEAG